MSQDDGLEVAALIAKVATIRYNGSESVSSFLDSINDLHTQLSEVTANDPDLKISDKLLAVFLLLSFPGDQFGTIRDHLFGDLKSLNTSKVVSRLRTKSALNSVDESVIAMATSARSVHQNSTRTVTPRTDRSPTAPCHLKEHWGFPHTNGVCSKQQHRKPPTAPRANHTSSQPQISDSEKVRRFNQLAAAGVIGFNTEASPTPNTTVSKPSQPPDDTPECQFATSYNTIIDENVNEIAFNVQPNFPAPSSTHKPTLADTACNRHMFGDNIMLEDIRDVEPIWIKVANADSSSRIVANKIGTARLHAYMLDGTPTYAEIKNVLYSPSLPANLISVTQLYDDGYKIVDPHYGKMQDDLNLYFSDSSTTLQH